MKFCQASKRVQAFGGRQDARCPNWQSSGFTLIELILVMTILTIAVSVTAPRLTGFFRGRALDSEARRLLALTRQGQSRAVSEGIPVELWVDAQNRKVGLEAEPSYEAEDGKAEEFTLDSDIQIEAVSSIIARPSTNRMSSTRVGPVLTKTLLSRHPELPRIRFLPDGSIAESSPRRVTLTGSDGFAIGVAQSVDGSCYEVSTGNN